MGKKSRPPTLGAWWIYYLLPKITTLKGDKMKYNNEELKAGRISWANFFSFYGIDHILCNNIAEVFPLELVNVPEGETSEDEDPIFEIFQYYLIKENDLKLVEQLNEPILYCEELDQYILGVTHWGTGWDYVLSPVKLVKGSEGLLYPTF